MQKPNNDRAMRPENAGTPPRCNCTNGKVQDAAGKWVACPKCGGNPPKMKPGTYRTK